MDIGDGGAGKVRRLEARVAQLLVEVEGEKQRARRAEGEATGLRRALEETHARLLRQREDFSAREDELQRAIDSNPARRALEATVASLHKQVDAKNEELRAMLAAETSVAAAHEAATLAKTLARREEELQQTRLELMRYIRRCEALEADACAK